MTNDSHLSHREFPIRENDAGSMSGFMSALFESVDDGIIVGDTTGKIIFANDAALRINDDTNFPEAPEERILRYVSDDGSERRMRVTDLPLQKALTEGEVRGLEVTLLTPSGHKKNLYCNGRALYSANGDRIGAVLALHDQTNERRTEQQRLRLEKERLELLQINAELERFSAVAAHDLKSPLNSITQFVELLREELGDKLGPNEAELMQYISDAGARLRSLIDDLLTYARAGKSLGKMSSIDLAPLVDEVLSSLSCDMKAANATIEVGPLPVVYADRIGIYQVFQNLIANAIKYRSERPPVIRISAAEEGNFWHFMIQDNGIGMREADQAMAFELFKRFDISPQTEGTGLGLAICKRIVEAHGGSIGLESQKGVGTTLSIILPKSLS